MPKIRLIGGPLHGIYARVCDYTRPGVLIADGKKTYYYEYNRLAGGNVKYAYYRKRKPKDA